METKTIKNKFYKYIDKASKAKSNKKIEKNIEKLIGLSKIQNYELEDGQTYIVCGNVKILDKLELPGYFFKDNWRNPQELILTKYGVFINVPRRNEYKVGKKYNIILNTWNGLTFIDDPKYTFKKDGEW